MNQSLELAGVRDRTPPGVGTGALPGVGEHPGFTLARAFALLVVAMFALAVAGVHGLTAWLILTALASWCVVRTHPLTALVAGGQTWAVETGFGVHRNGLLTFTGADLARLTAVVAVTVLVAVVTRRASAVATSRLREDLPQGR